MYHNSYITVESFLMVDLLYNLIEIACGIPPPPPLRGGYAFTGMHYGDTVTYDCECDYDLDGPQTLTCGSSGEWGQPPCCLRECYYNG